jgi:carbonic anhydrase
MVRSLSSGSFARFTRCATAAAIIVALAGTAQTTLASDDHGHSAPAPSAKPASAPKTTKTTPSTSKPAAKVESKSEPKAEAKDEHVDTNDADAANEPAPASTKSTERMRTTSSAVTDVPENPTAEQALKFLVDGNTRWVSNNTQDPNTDPQRRALIADKGQKPFATILTCADSRLPVERLFDRGVGELFTVRVAGNTAGTSETGTIEYGVGHLKTPLLVVMGHTKCGAVAAAASKAELHGAVAELVSNITPAVDRAKRNNPNADDQAVLNIAVKENVWQTIFTLIKTSSELRESIASGKVKVVGAVCDISTGKVEFMGEHPWQVELVDAMNAREKARQANTATANAETKDEHGH